MFFMNLRDYVFRRNARRLRDDRISFIVAFAVSMWMLLIGQPERSAAISGVAALGLCMLTFTVYYCQNPATTAARYQRHRNNSPLPSNILYRPVTRRLAWISVAALLVLFPLPQIEAAVLDRRLRKMVRTVPLDRQSIERITQTFAEANRYGVRPPLHTISIVQAALRKTSEAHSSLSDDATKAASAAASAATIDIGLPPDMQGPLFGNLPEAKGSKWAFSPIATNKGPDNYQTIGIAQRTDVAKMEKIDQPLPPTGAEYGPAVLVVKDLTATLDGWHLKHVAFENMKLIYHGGPLLLEAVYFVNCQLECMTSDNSWRLISDVTNGGWITVSMQ
jgi:hypothetical protein